jgi:hypothetical protein
MAIISFGVDEGGLQAGIDENFQRTYAIKYKVMCTNGTGPGYVRNNLGWTIGTSTYAYGSESDLNAKCNNITVDGPTFGPEPVYSATVSFGKYDPFVEEHIENPLSQPLKVTFEGVSYQRVIDLDINGNPIDNTAGDPFDPGIEADEIRQTFRVVQNFASPINPFNIFSFGNCVNSDTWFGFPPKSIKTGIPLVERLFSQFLADTSSTGNYWQVTWVFDQNPDGWQKSVGNMGMRQLAAGSTTKRVAILDSGGMVLQTPAWLDINGHYLQPPVTSSNILIIDFDIYPAISFTGTFGFPSTLFG